MIESQRDWLEGSGESGLTERRPHAGLPDPGDRVLCEPTPSTRALEDAVQQRERLAY